MRQRNFSFVRDTVVEDSSLRMAWQFESTAFKTNVYFVSKDTLVKFEGF